MMSLAEYSFLPWARRGIANQIDAGAGASARVKIPVVVSLQGGESNSVDLPARDIQLVGPGDITGINPLMVIRTEPRNWVTDFEPNYLSFIEFYDEDFPWRYTPEPPAANHRLTPWMTLMVLKESEFSRVNIPNRPLHSVKLTSTALKTSIFAPDGELWAWAHVHLNEKLAHNNHAPDTGALNTILSFNPDKGISRIFSPRKLEPETPYYAFLIPTFDVGRKTGLGITVNDSDPAHTLSWQTEAEFPIYFEWFFRTGKGGDFEELVRLLKPRDMPKEVGIRDMDITNPGFGVGPINVLPTGLVGMEGALLAPTSQRRPLDFDAASNFPEQIEPLVNLADDIKQLGSGADPLITPPLYGRWHALTNRLSREVSDKNWVNEMNLDARYRAAGGLGSLVVQKNQEDYMRQAWQQIGDVLSANQRISMSQMAMLVSQAVFNKNLTALTAVNALPVLAPVFKKVMGSPATIHYLHKTSALPRAVFGGPFRRLLRPRGLMSKRVFGENSVHNRIGETIGQINEGIITAAEDFPIPAVPTFDSFVKEIIPELSSWIRWILARRWMLFGILVIILALLVFFFFSIPFLTIGIAVAGVAFYQLRRWIAVEKVREGISALKPGNQKPEDVDKIPGRPTFELFNIASSVEPADISTGEADNETGANFRVALKDYLSMIAGQPARPEPMPVFNMENAHAKVMAAIEPLTAFPKRIGPTVRAGGMSYQEYLGKFFKGVDMPDQQVTQVKAYPDIKKAMYEPLRDISKDFLVPNLNQIPPNTISLMITNQPFIESYMVGLNHEFVGELLWREYPTDQRGSVFRQFWNPVGYVDQNNQSKEQIAEKTKDIKPIHTWPVGSALGAHNNRDAEGDASQLVLVIRGELLKRYPNTVIYAQRAKWGSRAGEQTRLVMWDETGIIAENDPNEKNNVKYPIFSAEVDPDIHFIGFDLNIGEARGAENLREDQASKDSIPANELGWFFIIKERPGEPRFGMDVAQDPNPSPKKWDNMSWDLLGNDVKVISFATAAGTPNPPRDPANNEGLEITWGSNSADMAYILYQKPVLVAVHAMGMLKDLK